MQSVTIDLVGLRLKQSTFGALTLSGCNEVTCSENAILSFELSNDGSASLSFLLATRSLNGELRDLLPELPAALQAGETATVTEFIQLDVCSTDSIDIVVTTEAEPEDGPTCTGGDHEKITFDP